jgi:hypothetical protein
MVGVNYRAAGILAGSRENQAATLDPRMQPMGGAATGRHLYFPEFLISKFPIPHLI